MLKNVCTLASTWDVWVAVETILAIAEISGGRGRVNTAAIGAPASHRQASASCRTRTISDGPVQHDRDVSGHFIVAADEVLQGEVVPRLLHCHGVGAWELHPHGVPLPFYKDRNLRKSRW